MRSYRFELILGLVFVLLILAVWCWQNPGGLRQPLSRSEQEHFLAELEKLPLPEAERQALRPVLSAWMQGDDGRPFYMLNLMRYHPALQPLPGAPAFAGTPQQSNAYYEDRVMPLLLKVGGQPLYAGTIEDANLLEHAEELDHWSRLLLVRYPNRRAFLKLLTDPAYAPIEPYKFMALKVMLTPTMPEMVLPPLHALLAALLLPLYLALGWWRAVRAQRA